MIKYHGSVSGVTCRSLLRRDDETNKQYKNESAPRLQRRKTCSCSRSCGRRTDTRTMYSLCVERLFEFRTSTVEPLKATNPATLTCHYTRERGLRREPSNRTQASLLSLTCLFPSLLASLANNTSSSSSFSIQPANFFFTCFNTTYKRNFPSHLKRSLSFSATLLILYL